MNKTLIALTTMIGCMMMAAASDAGTTAVTIDPRDEKQVIHSFGASDAWTCQFVGENWPLEKRNAIADLLFSKDVDREGNPKGIALSMWRFNVGAGSAEQGDESGISNPWQRVKCFLAKDGKYDWSKQKGQQWFLEAAHIRGVPYLLAFTNSPPVQFTINGIAHSSDGRWTYNIRKDAMPAFADFLAEVAGHFAKKGLPIDYFSPMNEPQYIWESAKQEGTPAENVEIAEITRLLSQRLHDKGLASKVVVPEAARLDYLYWKEGNPRQNQADAFWNPSSPCYIGNLPNVGRAISAHSYFSSWPLTKQVDMRLQLSDRLGKLDPKLAFWQTEYCPMESNGEIGGGPGRDTGIDTALYIARVIQSDLTLANAAHWSWWLAVSRGNYKDGLVYIDGDHLETDGQVTASKTLWALGNFSRFVRPGMVRVGVEYGDHRSPLDAAQTLMVSAYLDKKTRQLVIVAVNCTTDPQPIRLAGLSVENNSFATYTTSKSCDLTRGTSPADTISIPPRSVVTLTGRVSSPEESP
jgi:O-glycosyl hydrolase